MANMKLLMALVGLVIALVACVMTAQAYDLGEHGPSIELDKRPPYKPTNPCGHIKIRNGSEFKASERECHDCCAEWNASGVVINLFGLVNLGCRCAFGPF